MGKVYLLACPATGDTSTRMFHWMDLSSIPYPFFFKVDIFTFPCNLFVKMKLFILFNHWLKQIHYFGYQCMPLLLDLLKCPRFKIFKFFQFGKENTESSITDTKTVRRGEVFHCYFINSISLTTIILTLFYLKRLYLLSINLIVFVNIFFITFWYCIIAFTIFLLFYHSLFL